jgi:ABC-type glycerol-3-phosphate transport system permease component
MKRHWKKRLLVHILLIITVTVILIPILWLFLLSVRPNAVIQRGLESVVSTEIVLDHYILLFTRYNVWQYLFNSLVAAVVPSIISVFVALLASYSLVRFRFRGRTAIMSLPLFAQIVPSIQLIVPFYAIFLVIGLLNSYTAVILAHISLVLPITIWMMTGYLKSVPREMEEAALVDGCSRLGAIFRIVLPVAMPGIVATALVAYLMTWGEFLFVFILTSTDSMRVLATALYLFIPSGNAPASWGLLFAMATVFMIPTLFIFILLQASLQKGLSLGAVAGK